MPQEYQVVEVQKSLPEGMIFVRITYIFTVMVRAPIMATCLLLLTLSSFIQYAICTPKVLEFTIYSDGTTHVFYQTDVDPQSPDFTLNLFGKNVENVVVQDENGTLLSSKVDGENVIVETLGASTIKVDYDTADQISKLGKTWTFKVNSPIAYSILLPKNTVIVGMSTSPLNMQIVDGQSLISLPSGSSDINYIFGSIGTSQTATIAIQKAQDFINTVNSAGVKTPLALAKLEEAKSQFNQGMYPEAEALANMAKNLTLQEQQSANPVPATTSDSSMIPIIIVAGVVTSGAIGLIILKKTKSNKIAALNTIPKIDYVPSDIETIYRIKPELRQDDKNIVAFISEKGGQVYESELRKKFLMPRTTMWRAVKRLEREEIIEIEKVDQQNLIKLRKIGGDQ